MLSPRDVFDSLCKIKNSGEIAKTTILDPWYNRGVGGVSNGYMDWLERVVHKSAEISEHIFLWGFPEIVCGMLARLPAGWGLNAWLTWYYKNCPSVIRGWRSAQFACLHLVSKGAVVYPEHFMNETQIGKHKQGKLRFMPGPPTVLEAPLNIGFVGRNEQTGHPAQKPEKVIEPLILMTTKEGDLVADPMCGSGTTGAVCKQLGRRAVICDESDEYASICEARLSITRSYSLKYWQRNSYTSRLVSSGAD